jgi:hypothetical protein
MKLALPLGCLVSVLAFAAGTSAQDGPDDYVANRIAQLEQDERDLRRKAFERTDGQAQTVLQAVRMTSANLHELNVHIPVLEAWIVEAGGRVESLEADREAIESGQIFRRPEGEVLDDEARKRAADAAEDIALAGASAAAQRAAFVFGLLVDAGQGADKWRIKYQNLGQLERDLENNQAHLSVLNDLLRVFNAERWMVAKDLLELEEMQRRYVAIDRELTMLRARQPTAGDPFEEGRDQVDGADATATTTPDVPAGPCRGFNGLWGTNYGPVTLRVADGRAIGSYDYSGNGTLSGTVAGNVLSARWQDGTGAGSVRLQLSADGGSFSGRWTRESGDGNPQGEWRGTCQTP